MKDCAAAATQRQRAAATTQLESDRYYAVITGALKAKPTKRVCNLLGISISLFRDDDVLLSLAADISHSGSGQNIRKVLSCSQEVNMGKRFLNVSMNITDNN